LSGLPFISNIFTQREENTLRKIIVSMRVTLDGFIAGPHGEMDWMEEFFDETLANYESDKHQDASFRGGSTLLPADKGIMEYFLI
jgi:hypothetical protein